MSRLLVFLAFSALLCPLVSASDSRLKGFWVRVESGKPSARWTLSADGKGSFEKDFGPSYPGFVLTTYFTWSTNAANNAFTYTVSRQSATGNGPYNYDEVVSPAKTYTSAYTITGTTNKLWAFENYSYAQAASVTEGKTLGPGTLDLSYNKTGIVSFANLGQITKSTPVTGAALQPRDGKVVVASVYSTGSSKDFALSRYNIDGTLDKTFNATGTRITDLGGESDETGRVAVDPRDGKIIVIGASDGKLALARYTPAGALDTGFNGTGKVLTDVLDVNESSQGISGVTIQPSDGKIIVVGSTYSSQSSQSKLLVLRYLPNGTLDTTFNGTGRAVISQGYGKRVAIQPADGKIVVGGGSAGWNYTIWRFNTNGTLDTTFNAGGPQPGQFGIGQLHIDSYTGYPNCMSIAVRPSDGKIVSSGQIYCGNGVEYLLLASNNPDGTPDTMFNGNGQLVEAVSTAWDYRYPSPYDTIIDGAGDGVAIQNDGKIVVSGSALTGDWPDYKNETAVMRYHVDGTPDTTFYGTGKAFVEIGGGIYSSLSNLLIQPADGKIVAVCPDSMARVLGRNYTPPTTKKYYSVKVARVLASKGTVVGGGAFAAGRQVTLKANPKNGYRFTGWKENGKFVSKNATYRFPANRNRSLVAVFVTS